MRVDGEAIAEVEARAGLVRDLPVMPLAVDAPAVRPKDAVEPVFRRCRVPSAGAQDEGAVRVERDHARSMEPEADGFTVANDAQSRVVADGAGAAPVEDRECFAVSGRDVEPGCRVVLRCVVPACHIGGCACAVPHFGMRMLLCARERAGAGMR